MLVSYLGSPPTAPLDRAKHRIGGWAIFPTYTSLCILREQSKRLDI